MIAGRRRFRLVLVNERREKQEVAGRAAGEVDDEVYESLIRPGSGDG